MGGGTFRWRDTERSTMYGVLGFSLVAALGVAAILLTVWLFLKPMVLGPAY